MKYEGGLKIHDSIFHFEVTASERPVQRGIRKGKITKLLLNRDGETFARYDAAWKMKPVNEDAEIAVAILLMEHN